MSAASSLVLVPSTRIHAGAVAGGRKPDRQPLAVFRSAQDAVLTRMLWGQELSEVERELIDPTPLSSDWQAALWLFAWSLLPPSYQLAEVESHVALLHSSAL